MNHTVFFSVGVLTVLKNKTGTEIDVLQRKEMYT